MKDVDKSLSSDYTKVKFSLIVKPIQNGDGENPVYDIFVFSEVSDYECYLG